MEQKKMKAAVLRDIGRLSLEQRPVPEAKDHDVVVRVAYTGICGTDLGAFRTLSLPAGTVMGHEFAGWVEEIGPAVTNCKPGDRIVVRPCSICFKCPWCKEGRISLCPDHLYDTVGLKNVPGGYAEYSRVQDYQVFPMKDTMTMEQAAQLEPLAVAVHAVEESNIQPGQRVLIIGAGSIGLLILQYVWHKSPAEVVVMEKSAFRRSMAAKEKGTVVVSEPEELDAITAAYPRFGFDAVIETAGKPVTVRKSLSAVCKGGQVTFVGMSTTPVEIDHFHLVFSGIHISNSVGYFVEHWAKAMELMETGKVVVDDYVTSVYPLDDIENGFRALLNPEKDLKILIRSNS